MKEKTQKGMLAGAGVGAAAGTAVSPGLGTAAGAILGAGIGGMLAGAGENEFSYSGPYLNIEQREQALADQAQARFSQWQVALQLQQQAQGKGPSVANAQLQQSLAANQAQQQAAANSARGGVLSQAAAQRTAQMTGAQQQQQTANQASVLRAQEALGAQQQLQNLYNTQRAQDLQHLGTESSWQLGLGGLQNQQANINADVATANAANEAGFAGGLMKMGGGMFGSDERIKQHIKPADAEIQRFLDALASRGPKRFEYRGDPGREYFGVMAQDLEHAGPVGQSLVRTDPRTGTKMIDTTTGFGALLAANAALEERLSRLEALRRKGGK